MDILNKDLKKAVDILLVCGDGRSVMRSPAERLSWVQLPVPAFMVIK